MATLIGEWNFIDTLTAPPSNGQIRMNQTLQSSTTKLWVNRTTATGANATAVLQSIPQGQQIRIDNKSDPSKWQTYAVNGPPVTVTTHLEYPVAWVAGGGAVPQQRSMFYTLPAGVVSVPLDPIPRMNMHVGSVTVKGMLVTPDYAYPFLGAHAISPGLTKRQWYAGQAMIGFISNAPAANLMGGKLADYCFKVADSMLAFEVAEEAGRKPPLAGA